MKSYWAKIFQGDHSTKIENVVKCLMHIKSTTPNAKSLVFSTVNTKANNYMNIWNYFFSSSGRKYLISYQKLWIKTIWNP